MGELAIMGKEGDTKTMWNPDNPDEVTVAQETFARWKAKGFAMYKTNAAGDKGEQIREFDASYGKIIAVPPMRGG